VNWLGSSEFKQLLKTCDNFQEIVLRSCTLLSLIYIIENTKPWRIRFWLTFVSSKQECRKWES